MLLRPLAPLDNIVPRLLIFVHGMLILSSHLTYKFLSEELYEYLDAAIMVQTSPEEAYRKVKHTEHTVVLFRSMRLSGHQGCWGCRCFCFF